MVFSLVYSSTTDHDWSQDSLALLEWSRGWNADHGVTGLLLYRDCAFMQSWRATSPSCAACSPASAPTGVTRTST